MTIKTFNINTDKTAFVRAYLPDSIAGLPFCEKRPAVLIFPGGGYEYCSDREGEPIALQYLALDTPRSWLHIAATSASQSR